MKILSENFNTKNVRIQRLPLKGKPTKIWDYKSEKHLDKQRFAIKMAIKRKKRKAKRLESASAGHALKWKKPKIK